MFNIRNKNFLKLQESLKSGFKFKYGNPTQFKGKKKKIKITRKATNKPKTVAKPTTFIVTDYNTRTQFFLG